MEMNQPYTHPDATTPVSPDFDWAEAMEKEMSKPAAQEAHTTTRPASSDAESPVACGPMPEPVAKLDEERAGIGAC